MARRLGPYAPLSATYYTDDAVIEAGEDAELLYLRMLAFCAGRVEQDGYITPGQIKAVASPLKQLQRRIDTLVNVGLWEPKDGGYLVRAWLKWNASADDLGKLKAKDRGRKAAITTEVRTRIYERDGNRCRYCGATDNLCIDHVKPQHHGGGHEDGNLQALCHPCNQRKGTRDGTGISREQARESYGINYGNPVDEVQESRSRGRASAVIVTKVGTEHGTAIHDTPPHGTAASRGLEVVPGPQTGENSDDEKINDLIAALKVARFVLDWSKLPDDERSHLAELVTTHGVSAMVRAAQKVHDERNPTRYGHRLLGTWDGMLRPGDLEPAVPCEVHWGMTLPCTSCAGDAKAGAA